MKKNITTTVFTLCFSIMLFSQDSTEVKVQLQDQSTVIDDAQEKQVITEASVEVEAPAYEESEDNSLYVMVQEMPEYPGGVDSMKVFLNSNINYKGIKKTKATQEMVRIEFVIEKDGEMTNLAILKSSGNNAFDNEAMRVVRKMPFWKAGMLDGKLVRTKIIIPVRYNQ